MVPENDDSQKKKKKSCSYCTSTFPYQVSLSYAHIIFYSAIKEGDLSAQNQIPRSQCFYSYYFQETPTTGQLGFGLVWFSNLKLSCISKLGDVFPCYDWEDVLAERALPAHLDADRQRLLLSAAFLASWRHPSACQPWVNWVAFKSLGT